MDIASLGIKIDTSDAAKASTDMDKMVDSGVRAEETVKRTGKAWEQALGGMAADTQQIVRELQALNAKQDATARAMVSVGKSITDASSSFQAAANSIGTYRERSEALNGTQEKVVRSAERAAVAIKQQTVSADSAVGSFRALHGGTTALEAGMFSLGNSIKNGTFVDSLKSTQEAKAWLASLNATTKESGVAFLEAGQKLTYLSTGLKGLGAWSGSGTPVFGQISKQGAEATAGLVNFNKAAIQTGVSAKQTAAALRGVPAQFTDIVTSLQAGQAPLQVFLQQGGQLKDMFGGVGPAAKALGGYVLALVNPFTVAAAAAAALGFAYYKGSQESTAYNTALVLTGNAAGTSADQLATLAGQVSATVGTTGAAAEVLAKLAGNSKIAGESFGEIATAALEMEKTTGKAIDETIAEFAKIAKDPVAAAKELNDQYGFLTAAVYSQIVALKEQGDTIGAAKLLTDTYASTINSRTGEITQNLGLIESAWKGIKSAALGALDATLNIGRTQTLEQQAEEIRQRLKSNQGRGGRAMALGLDTRNTEQDKKDLDYLELQIEAEKSRTKFIGDRVQVQQEGIEAAGKLKALSDANLSNEEKRNKLIKEYQRDVEKLRAANPDDPLVQAAVVAKNIQNIKDKNKDPAGKANQLNLTGYNDAQNAIKELQATYSNSEKELEAQQKAGLITQQNYLDQRTALIRAEREEVTGAYQAEIAALEAVKDKSGTTGQQRIELDQKIADARTSMVKAQKDADSQLEILATNEEGRVKKQALAIKTYTDALQQQAVTLRNQGQRDAAGLGQGDRQKALSGQFNSIDDKANAQRIDLANQYGDGSRGMSLDEYNAKLKAVAQSQQDLRNVVVANYDDMTSAQGSWSAGASSAWENYLESTRDVAGQTKSLFTNAFSSAEDAFTRFVTTGKASFSDLAKSILADMARIAARQASSSALSGLFGLAANVAGTYFGGSGNGLASGSAGATSSNVGASQAGYSSTYFPQAKGGAWAGGVQMFANGGAFSDSVISTPTAFGMANGKTGVMGEAGPEAIVPLARDSQGRLGVRGGANSSTVNVSVTVDASEGGGASPDPARLAEAIKVVCRQEISLARRNGGQLT
ncbi:phage tail tape measure protein [Pseudomonas sp. FP1742]|uniref:phage tail tape measure protein n=1 Tax=Pseudomonas sp. FP1742 TaxID=2954079 RepID=UPI002735090B|nr:phage tail tape measure protein [Pseudomonas sp. FP1742]WLG49106.1 phage tail tape measure protein [Pseudomonas sp. FP1742]